MALMYMVIALSLFIAFLFLIMQSIASRTTRTSAVIASSSGFMPLQDEDDMEMDQVNYGTTNKGSARRRFMPTNSDDKYNRLPQDAEDDDDKEEETDLLI
ncbi:hypothetical protein KUTeg_023049 [Tegillarca granosa]|uniref:Uncharacterized protein n=1 Tax=Tegillarca granosa TaxID=220873 RepID=A0ABQ9E0Y2_TEGGR|nr:hypothetical protein KUTeg_023049 [Tegillarca granosa]